MENIFFKNVVSENELSEFVYSWELAFKRKLEDKIYQWIFNKENNIYVYVDRDGKVLAGYCLYPMSCVFLNKRTRALLCNNVFVHPEYQSKNLFVRLGRESLKHATENNLGNIAFGVPNKLALSGHKRVGWGVQNSIIFLEKQEQSRSKSTDNNILFFYKRLPDDIKNQIENLSITLSYDREFSIIKIIDFLIGVLKKSPIKIIIFPFIR